MKVCNTEKKRLLTCSLFHLLWKISKKLFLKYSPLRTQKSIISTFKKSNKKILKLKKMDKSILKKLLLTVSKHLKI